MALPGRGLQRLGSAIGRIWLVVISGRSRVTGRFSRFGVGRFGIGSLIGEAVGRNGLLFPRIFAGWRGLK